METLKKKVFAVDDESEILEFLNATVESMGFEFLSAENAMDGLVRIEKEKPDLILLDVMLPDMDGVTMCQRLKSNPKTKDIPIFMLTALTDSVTIQESLIQGSLGYISKPFDHDLIKEKIEKVFKKVALKAK